MAKKKRRVKRLSKPPQTAHNAAVGCGVSPESGLADGLRREQSNMDSISGGAKIKKATKWPTLSENLKGKASDVNPMDKLFGGRKKRATLEEIEEYSSWLKKMSEDKKQGLFRMSIRNLRERVGQMKDCLPKATFLAALNFFEEHKTWKRWSCSFCDVWYADKELLLQHLAKEHGWKFLLEFDEIDAPDESVLNHRILVVDDSLHLHLEKKILRPLDDYGETYTISDGDESVLGEDKAFLYWLYYCSVQEDVVTWKSLLDILKELAIERSQVVKIDLDILQERQKINSGIKNSIRATESIKSIIVAEVEERKQGAGHAIQSFASILSRRLEELVMADVEAISCHDKLEIEAIKDILRVSKKGFNPDQLDHNDSLAPARGCFESIDDEPIEDRCIRIAIQRRLEGLSLKNLEGDEFIVKTVVGLRQQVAFYMRASVLDYQTIMVSFLRPFVQENFEVFVVFFREDAKKKAEAAAKMLLGVDAAETEKNFPAGKSKSKKKNKDLKKAKNKNKDLKKAKGSKGNNLYKLEGKEKDAKQAFFPLGDSPNSGISAAATAELIEDERKLEQALERQRRLEDEAKQKQQADHERKITVASKSVSVFGDYRKNLEADEQELQQEEKTTTSTVVTARYVSGSNALVATGLKNDTDTGVFNCFLNVIVQSLWHLRSFREEFLTISESMHLHIRDACVCCALHDIFKALSVATAEARRGSVSPMSLRVALSKVNIHGNTLQEGQMNDPSEALEIILKCIHCSLFWKCTRGGCITHKFFGMRIHEEVRCVKCGTISRILKYTAFSHFVNASKLRFAKPYFMIRTSLLKEREKKFDEILMHIQATDKRTTCDPYKRGCGEFNNYHYILSTRPRVFIAVLVWESDHERLYSISATLEALDTKIDLAVIYEGFDAGQTHHLVSIDMVYSFLQNLKVSYSSTYSSKYGVLFQEQLA